MATPSLGRTLRRIAWVLVAAVIALGGAGLVAGASLPPTDAARPELTVRGDASMAPGLTALNAGLTSVDDRLGQLVGTGEQVLVDLTGMTSGSVAPSQISDDLQQGDDQLLAIEEQAQSLQATYAQLPFDASSDRISGRTKGRLAAIRQALDLLAPVTGDWQAVSTHATVTAKLLSLLQQNVAAAGQAVLDANDKDVAGQAKAPDLKGALAELDQADAYLTQAGTIRDQLAPTTDMSTYDQWVSLHQAYEAALRRYLQAHLTTNDVRILTPLYNALAAAYAQLPRTTAPLVVILGDLEATGLTDGVGDIQRARTSLEQLARVD
ncbi:MAG TPA: hypothetical protein VN771_05485 [Candidatus Baltobacteraceae bacterium]|nr:hypothetical protein [Candidatus Baltobacteraceae bacterium]